MICQFQRIVDNLFENGLFVKVIVKTGTMESRSRLNSFLPAGRLYGAVSGTEMHPLVVGGAEQLNFQVIIVAQALLDQHSAVAKLPLCIILELAIDPTELFNFNDFFNSHAAAAGGCFNKNRRIFNSIFLLFFQEGGSNFFCFHFIIDRCIGAWNRRNTKLIGDTLGINFVAKILDNLPVRSDKRQGTISVRCPAGKPEVF